MGKKTFLVSIISLIVVFTFFELTDADMIFQNSIFNPEDKSWILKDPDQFLHKIFYTGIKIPIYIIGVSALIASVISWKKKIWSKYRKGLLIVTLSLILLPGLIAVVGKNVTDVQCPYDLNCFEGHIPYVKHFEPYPPNPNSPDGKWFKGRCWPAGHASGGFALFSLVCFFHKRNYKIAAFIFAFSTGWIMALYQILRGAHFISHNITTMLLSLILVSALNIFIKDFSNESSQLKK